MLTAGGINATNMNGICETGCYQYASRRPQKVNHQGEIFSIELKKVNCGNIFVSVDSWHLLGNNFAWCVIMYR